jgi:hypothetical protein
VNPLRRPLNPTRPDPLASLSPCCCHVGPLSHTVPHVGGSLPKSSNCADRCHAPVLPLRESWPCHALQLVPGTRALTPVCLSIRVCLSRSSQPLPCACSLQLPAALFWPCRVIAHSTRQPHFSRSGKAHKGNVLADRTIFNSPPTHAQPLRPRRSARSPLATRRGAHLRSCAPASPDNHFAH